MKIGYARVSSSEQQLDLQLDALAEVGCEKIFTDKISAVKNRPGLDEAIAFLREGDTLVVWKLDRLGRSVKTLIRLLEELKDRGIYFISITNNLDTSSAMGKLVFHILASFSELERDLLIERTRAGLDAAKKRGRTGGRKRLMTDSKIEYAKELMSSGKPPKEVAAVLGVSVATLYRWCPAT